MNAGDLMTRNTFAVHGSTTVEEIARIITRNRISSVPVIDDNDHVIGIVSEHDLFMKDKGIPYSAVKLPTRFEKWVGHQRLVEIYESSRHHTAADIMTTDVISVDIHEHIGHVAWLMMQWGIDRLPVLEHDRLVGMISRTDLIRLLAEPTTEQELKALALN